MGLGGPLRRTIPRPRRRRNRFCKPGSGQAVNPSAERTAEESPLCPDSGSNSASQRPDARFSMAHVSAGRRGLFPYQMLGRRHRARRWRGRDGECQPSIPAGRPVCRVKLTIGFHVQVTLHVSYRKQIAELRADAQDARAECAENGVLTGINADLLVDVSDEAHETPPLRRSRRRRYDNRQCRATSRTSSARPRGCRTGLEARTKCHFHRRGRFEGRWSRAGQRRRGWFSATHFLMSRDPHVLAAVVYYSRTISICNQYRSP
jgi:hypothetical protein